MEIHERLAKHLASWLGVWPPPGSGVTVVSSERRTAPGWDGTVRMVAGVSTPEATVLSVPPDAVEAVRALGRDLDAVRSGIGEVLGQPNGQLFTGVFRWSEEPGPDVRRGVWLPTTDPRVLPWLKPFNGDVLVGFEGRDVAAGVGRKQHDEWGHELAVVTEPAHRGNAWATDLIAQAAHRVIADGAVPTYLHAPNNAASARTADAAGFPDRGWQVHGFASVGT